ncbi:hypothetical protein [uncultured Kushneria sp.]|uniref:hypothetical protein n=1 Tax=uncultured Kushneria sp. TaxID=905033 RepID=UPI00261CC1B1|nr:hypothetical protein [uncultured Kushneria sp.]
MIDVEMVKKRRFSRDGIAPLVIDHLKRDSRRPRSRYSLAMLTGMRGGKLLALESGNVNSGFIVLKLGQTKSGKPEVIPLFDEVQLLTAALPFATTLDKVRNALEKARGHEAVAYFRHCFSSYLERHEQAAQSNSLLEALVTLRREVINRHLHSKGSVRKKTYHPMLLWRPDCDDPDSTER